MIGIWLKRQSVPVLPQNTVEQIVELPLQGAKLAGVYNICDECRVSRYFAVGDSEIILPVKVLPHFGRLV